MAVIKIEAKKDTRCTQTICLIRGDRRTQILRFGVNRFDGGVDLSDLAWVIKTVNANGVEDVFDPEAVEIGESRITVDWLVEGSVTDADGLAKYELNGLDTVGEDVVPVIWRGGTGTISLRADISPKFGESDGMTNIEKLILYVDGELQNVIDAGSAAADAAARANRAADNVEDLSGAVERANAAAQRATDAAAAVEDLEGAVTRANSAAALATDGAMRADAAASMAYSAATRATEAAKNVENIEEATVAAYDAADDARMAAEVANTAGLPAAMIYGRRVMGETAKATGNPVSFLPDAGSLLQPVTVLEPQQEGSGEPYPMGGGRNLCVLPDVEPVEVYGITFSCSNGVVKAKGTATANASTGATISYRIPKGTSGTYFVSGSSGETRVFVKIDKDGASSYPHQQSFTLDGTETNAMLFIQVNAGYTIDDTVYPMLNAGTTVLPWEAPSNIRPFIGYDKLDLNHAGKNLLPTGTAQTIKGVTFAPNADGSISVKGTAAGNVFYSANGLWDALSMKGGAEYILSGTPATAPTGVYLAIVGGVMCKQGVEVTFSYTENTPVKVVIVVEAGNTVDYVFYPMIRLASDPDATLQPYHGTLHTVQIGQTVYGGKFDWLTGKGLIEWVATNLSHESVWSSISTIGDFTRAILHESLTDAAEPEMALSANGLCSHAKYITDWAGEFTHVYAFDTSAVATFPTALVGTTSDSINAWIEGQETAGTPVQIVYKLATPIEIQLTPHIISAVDPEQTNTLYGDGTIEVEYVKPLHVSIEERVAAALAAAAQTE